jgi:hypothetical protein
MKSRNVSGHKDIYDPFNETVFWGRTFVIDNLNYSGPHIEAFPIDHVNVNPNSANPASNALRAPIDEKSAFLQTWWPTATKVFDLSDFVTGNAYNCSAGGGCQHGIVASNNCTTAIQKCVDAAAAVAGAVCYIPPGNYPM